MEDSEDLSRLLKRGMLLHKTQNSRPEECQSIKFLSKASAVSSLLYKLRVDGLFFIQLFLNWAEKVKIKLRSEQTRERGHC